MFLCILYLLCYWKWQTSQRRQTICTGWSIRRVWNWLKKENMYDNFIETDEILEIYGNPNDFKLDILDPPDTEEDDINLVHQSPYYSIGDLPMYLQTIGNINVLSLNTQSVNAKFDSIITFLEVARQQNVHFQVICLQESWLNDIYDLSLFQINGFTCFSRGKKCSPHGGLITYVDSSLNASEVNIDVNSSVWEGLFVQIQDLGYTKDIIIGNIYRPPYDNNNKENISTFISELDPILSSINATRKDIIITGDFNINLLHINVCNKEHYGDFLDLMLGCSLIPKITLPTRMAENSCSLIDNIFCTISPNYISSQAGIIYSKISDHHPYFLSICPNNKEPPNNKRKYVKQRLNRGSVWSPETRINW